MLWIRSLWSTRDAAVRPPNFSALLLFTSLLLAYTSQAAADTLICDGQVRTQTLAEAPYPNRPPWTPWNGPSDLTCKRPLPGTSQQCGSMAQDFCNSVSFAPVLQASGPNPGIIPPNNPLMFLIKPESKAYLTYAEFTAGDIGTGGAQVSGLYSTSSNLPAVTNSYAWVKNGPTRLSNGNLVFDSCGDCRIGFGIKDLGVRAAQGTGFRAIQLSQLYPDTRCEGSGVNNDGMLWTGMKYSCVEPTCGDIDLDREGAQQFSCEAPYFFNTNAINTKAPSRDNCCITGPSAATCAAVVPGIPFSCPDGWQYNARSGSSSPPSVQTCCLKTSCGDIMPATNSGMVYGCPSGYEYNKYAGAASPPSTTVCCKLATCGDSYPTAAPNTPYLCAVDTVFNKNAASATPPSQEACCLRKTCGSPDPTILDQGFSCAPGTEFDPSMIRTSPPSQQACCKSGTCGTPNPITSPSLKYNCPSDSEYDPSAGSTSPANTNNCCKPKTCSNMQPVSNPGKAQFPCPSGKLPDMTAVNKSPPSEAICCAAFVPTCGNVNPATPGQRFDCSPQLFNLTAINQPASKQACCFDLPPTPQSDVDLYIIKTVSPAEDPTTMKLSTLQTTGYEFTFTLKVGMYALKGAVARDVVMRDNMPRGLDVKRVTENPSQNACSYTTRAITCRWATFIPSDTKTITVVAKAVEAGEWLNVAQVTTTSKETDPDNNRDESTARVVGACCIPATSGVSCNNTLPSACIAPSVFDKSNPCTKAECATPAPPPPVRTGACCVIEKAIAFCSDNVAQTDCKGKWNPRRTCSNIDCASSAPKGACCSVPDGQCRDGVTRGECPNSSTWQEGGKCGENSYCIGSCCNGSNGQCQEIKRETCMNPSKWTFYGRCDQITCPSPTPICTPAWYRCNPGTPDPCCPGYTCQPTYDKCVVGTYVCKPAKQDCVPGGSECGGKSRGCCCKGYACNWDHKKGKGTCWQLIKQCTSDGGTCAYDSDCCRGSRCKAGRCDKADCYRKCNSYECYIDRKKDCDAFYAAAASL